MEKTDNEIIAEFMDHSLADGFEIPNYRHQDLPGKSSVGWTKKPVNYNESWSWLMPVVEKISQLGNDGQVRPESKVYPVIDLPITTSISGVYKSVVDFIKWYNTQKQ